MILHRADGDEALIDQREEGGAGLLRRAALFEDADRFGVGGPPCHNDHPCDEALEVAVAALRRAQWRSELRQLWEAGRIDSAAELDTIHTEMKRLSVRAATPMLSIASLSGGNQQKAVLTRMLLTDPKVLILDEPTRGVDVGAKYEIYKLIFQLAQRGMSIVMVSSELPEVLGISDRVLVIGEGELRGDFVNDGLTQEDILSAAIHPVQPIPNPTAASAA